jgi:LPXTG-motif cell wall-anchored protein
MRLLMRTNSGFGKLATLGAAITIIAATASPVFAAPGPTGTAQPLAVSVPAQAASLKAGATGTIPIRVVNPGSTAVTVRITDRKVTFGDNGHVAIAGVDPAWAGRVELPTGPITIAAASYRDVGLTVHMPARIDPDLYFLGFLVTPVHRVTSSLTYVNQIGSYVTVDVPGPRRRVLTATLDAPGFALGGSFYATLHVRNVGKAAAVFWGENDTTAAPGTSSPRQQRLDDSLLPIGRSRAITLSARSSFLVSSVTMRVHIFYPGRVPSMTTQIVLTKHVVVVQPAAFVLIGAILIAGAVWLVLRRRRRRQLRSRRAGPRNRAPATRQRRARGHQPRRQPAKADKTAAGRVDRALAHARARVPTRE